MHDNYGHEYHYTIMNGACDKHYEHSVFSLFIADIVGKLIERY